MTQAPPHSPTRAFIDKSEQAEPSGITKLADSLPKEVVLNPNDPLPAARLFIDRHWTVRRQRTLHHHGGVFYAWSGSRYEAADPQAIRGQLYSFLDAATRRTSEGKFVPFQPNMVRVTNVIDAVRAISNVPATLSPPIWLAGAPPDAPPASEILPCANGLLHLPSLDLSDPSAALFSLNALNFAYEPHAQPPAEWLRFLTSLWPDDTQSITTLRDWSGYCLTADTRQHKILLVVGPKRAGKGTIGRVLTALLGQSNVCAPTLASLGQNFGLAPLIGKQLAIIADARLGGRSDQQAIAERLLSVSGEDGVTIDRKFLDPWTGRLSTRFMILTNELPRIADSSGALASRFIVLTLRESFLGREDHQLTDKLLAELPSILGWAIKGWQQLRLSGRMIQPESSMDAIQELEDLGSPVGAFLRERCNVESGHEVDCSWLFENWKRWCQAQGREHPGTVQGFGRDLRAAVPGLEIRHPREEDGRVRKYVGVGLKAGQE